MVYFCNCTTIHITGNYNIYIHPTYFNKFKSKYNNSITKKWQHP